MNPPPLSGTSGELRRASIDALRRDLESAIEGEVRFDAISRALYSTDASVYQIEPLGVVVARSRDDVVRTVTICAKHRCPLTMRGGGTSQAGQAIGSGVIVDTSKYFNRILEVNPAERWARVEPGVVLDELNAALRPHNLRFAPDISTASRATIGGMMANNSAGARSVLYGKTIDHVLEQHVVLSDGSLAHFRPLEPGQVDELCARDSLEGACYREVRRLVRENVAEIDRRYPKVLRRVGGYNLDALVAACADENPAPFNMAKLMVGSEGTLGVVLEAKLALVPLPKFKAVLAIQFADLLEALEATPAILAHRPSAIEVMDGFILGHTRQSPALEKLKRTFIDGDPAALLCVELYAEAKEDLAPRLDAIERDLTTRRLGYRYHRALDAAAQSAVWSVREAALGLSMAMKGDAKSLSFVEDTAVAPEKLRDYIDKFLQMIRRHGTTAGVYAHASVGCLHVRPVINMKTEAGVRQFAAIASDSADLVLEFGGALSGEHGDGLVRSGFMERMFGPALYDAFRHIKRTFDPGGIFNPGQDRRRAAAHGQSALRSLVSRRPAADVLRLFRSRRTGWRGRDVQRPRRLPQGAGRDDVPVVHGDAGGVPFDAGTRERAAAGHVGTPRRSGPRRRGCPPGARPVPGVPRLQGRVPGRRRRGAVQERVPRRLLAPPRDAHPCAHARTRPRRVAVGQPFRSAVECDRRKRACALAERAAARHGSASRTAGLDGHVLREELSETSARGDRVTIRCQAPSRSSMTRSPTITRPASDWRECRCSSAPDSRSSWRPSRAAGGR